MFDLKKVLAQLNITEEYFIDKLGIPASYFTKVLIEQIGKGDFGLKIFFIVVYIEALNVLAGKKDMSKIDMLIDFFNNKISVRDRQLILDNVKRISSSERLTDENYGEYINSAVNGTIKKDIDIEEFALIINNMRNLFVQEGIDWEFTFSDGKEHAMNIIDFPQKQYRGWVNQERIYDVNT